MYILFNIHLLYAKNNSSIVHDRFIKPLIIADSIDQVLEVLHMANSDCEYSCCCKKKAIFYPSVYTTTVAPSLMRDEVIHCDSLRRGSRPNKRSWINYDCLPLDTRRIIWRRKIYGTRPRKTQRRFILVCIPIRCRRVRLFSAPVGKVVRTGGLRSQCFIIHSWRRVSRRFFILRSHRTWNFIEF